MARLLDLIKKQRDISTELKYGIVRQVDAKDYKVKVELDNGLKTWVRYNGVLSAPEVDDQVLIGGRTIKFVIQDIEGVIPKTHVISNV